MTDRNTELEVAPVVNNTAVPNDTTHQTSDTSTTEPLLFRDKDLMSGITSLPDSTSPSPASLPGLELVDSEANGEQLISFVPPGGADQNLNGGNEVRPPVPARPPVTPQRISELITNLDSPAFRTRDGAQRDIEAAGAAALPQLLQAINSTQSLEVRRRAESAVGRITGNMSTEQLLALRDPAQRQQAIRDGLTAPLPADQTQRLNTALEGAARSGIENRLTTPGWLNDLDIGWKGKFGDFSRTPSEASVTQFDRMATPEGRRQVTQRLGELTRILGSEHISDAERETISRQIGEIARVSSPENIANGRVVARQNLADHLNATGGDPERVRTLMLEAHRLSDRPAQPQGAQQRFQRDLREDVRQNIVRMGLDQNPAFMQRFQAQAGQAEVQAIQAIRTQVEEQRNNENQQRGNK